LYRLIAPVPEDARPEPAEAVVGPVALGERKAA
jgi:hypothetical protein